MEGQKPKRQRPKVETRQPDDPYVAAALSGELTLLSNTGEGRRNDQLNISALKLARLPVDRDTLRDQLIDACHANGLIDDDGLPSVEATIDSAYRKADEDGPRETPNTSVSPSSSGPSGSDRDGSPVTGREALDATRAWLARFIRTVDDSDLDLLALWAAHTHFINDIYTTPRLLIDSPVPGSGKTTVLEHLERLCVRPVQMAAVSSPAMLTRLLESEMRTILIDEADRTLSPDKDGIGDLLAVLNSGYKRGATRPVSVPVKGGGWSVAEMSTYAPVAMAGNNPNLPDDTMSRMIRVLLVPDLDGEAEESDWELIESEAMEVRDKLASWAEGSATYVRKNRHPLPSEVKGRAKERWSSLKRIAADAGSQWPALVDQLAIKDVRRIELEREVGITQQRPHVVLLGHIAEVWPHGERFAPTDHLLSRLIDAHPDMWGALSTFGKPLTAQRLGRMLATKYNIHSTRRPDGDRARGYILASLTSAFRGLGVRFPSEPDGPDEAGETDDL
ncbi:hypothetical protein AU188_07910 [Mycobacterium sp. IS-3022]|nr:hypothetical protein AU188_07910 [Mycobacterium sp. IS-3022]